MLFVLCYSLELLDFSFVVELYYSVSAKSYAIKLAVGR